MSGREEKHEAEEKDHEEEEDEDDEDDGDDDISSSGGDDGDSGSEDDMSESGDAGGGDSKAVAASAANSRGSSVEQGARAAKERAIANQPFDEAMDLSESESSVAEDSPKKQKEPSAQVKNLPFDEALELSGSVQDIESPLKPAQKAPTPAAPAGQPAQQPAGRRSPNDAPPSVKTAAPAVGAEIKNRPHDEEVDLSDSDDGSVDTDGHPSPDRAAIKNRAAAAVPVREEKPAAKTEAARSSPAPMKDSTPPSSASVPSNSTAGGGRGTPAVSTTAPSASSAAAYGGPAKTQQQEKRQVEAKRGKHESESSSEESGSEEDDDDDEEEEGEEEEESRSASAAASAGGGAAAAGGAASASGSGGNSAQTAMMASAGSYKESDYAHLKVSNDVRELFQYIGRFKAQEVELETRLKCFIPEYIPAVGDMDAFLKIPRPDGEPDHLGLKMLDEPSLSQSDATVLDLQLRSTSKKKHGDIVVRSIENAEKSPKEIDRWIKSIADLHRTKPPPQVHYSKAMPDIESLMQVWPDEFEELLAKTPLPSASMDLALEQYVRVICAILDIPVHKNVYESLHVLFTLYLEFRSNQHFMNYDEQLESAQQMQQMQRGESLDAPPPFTSRRTEISTPDGFSSRK